MMCWASVCLGNWEGRVFLLDFLGLPGNTWAAPSGRGETERPAAEVRKEGME